MADKSVSLKVGTIFVVRISQQSIEWYFLEDPNGVFKERKMGIEQDTIREILLKVEPKFVSFPDEVFTHWVLDADQPRFTRVLN